MDAFNMTAPESGSKKERLVTKLVPPGPHVGILYSMIDLGDQWEVRYPPAKWQRKIQLIWELPMEKRVFYAGEEEKPCAIFGNYTFVISDKSILKKKVEEMIGRQLHKSEFGGTNGFNVGSLLGKAFILNIVHNPDKQDPNVIYENISTISPINDRTKAMMAGFPWEKIVQTNPTRGFAIDDAGQCFTTPAFGEIFGKTRTKCLNSKQGQAFLQNGGTAFEKPRTNEQQPHQTIPPAQQQSPPQQAQPEQVQQPVQQVVQQTVQPPVHDPNLGFNNPPVATPVTTPVEPVVQNNNLGFQNMPDPSKFIK